MMNINAVEPVERHNRIELFLDGESWYAHYPVGNPVRQRIIDAARTDTIVTEYTHKHTSAEVLVGFRKVNPTATLVLR